MLSSEENLVKNQASIKEVEIEICCRIEWNHLGMLIHLPVQHKQTNNFNKNNNNNNKK